MEDLASQHILHGLVMAVLVYAEHEARCQARLVGELGVEG